MSPAIPVAQQMTPQHEKAKRWQFGLNQLLKTVFVVATILGAGVALFPVFDGHPVTMRRLNKVKIGMTKAEVARLLGNPSGTQDSEDWRYHGWTWCMVVVTFDGSGRVRLVDHDH